MTAAGIITGLLVWLLVSAVFGMALGRAIAGPRPKREHPEAHQCVIDGCPYPTGTACTLPACPGRVGFNSFHITDNSPEAH